MTIKPLKLPTPDSTFRICDGAEGKLSLFFIFDSFSSFPPFLFLFLFILTVRCNVISLFGLSWALNRGKCDSSESVP